MIRLFVSYAHADEGMRQELGKHLASLKYQSLVEIWHDRLIEAGDEWTQAIDSNLELADVILLLVSPDFIASQYCYEVEMKEAMRRHDAGKSVVIPVILRPCEWQDLPFGKLQAATANGRPIVKCQTLDDGFLEVVQAIKRAASRLQVNSGSAPTASPARMPKLKNSNGIAVRPAPRSSNLHVTRAFSDHERDQFRTAAFEYIATLFENSLQALEERNPQLRTQYRRRDADSFEATVYKDGKQATRCGIWMQGDRFGGDIAFSSSGLGSGNSYNDSLSVVDDGHMLGLKAFGIGSFSGQRDRLMTLEGAAEYYWQLLIGPLQSR